MTFCLRTNKEYEMPGNRRDMITVAERRFPFRIRGAVPAAGLASDILKFRLASMRIAAQTAGQ
jgi:hypothetical protein